MSAVHSQVSRATVGLSNDNAEITATGTEHQTFGDNKHIVMQDV